MFIVSDKFFVKSIWFGNEIKNNIIYPAIYRDCYKEDISNKIFNNTICDINLTLVTSLLDNLDDIKAEFKKTVRYEINKADKLSLKISNRNYIKDEELNLLNEFYNSINMAEVTIDRLKKYNPENFKVTAIYHESQLICFHVYLYDDQRTRLLYSSCIKGKIISLGLDASYMNRYLHFKDIELFKNMGLEKYDWGGISSFEKPNGVDKFKMGFSGKLIEICTIYTGLLKYVKQVGVL